MPGLGDLGLEGMPYRRCPTLASLIPYDDKDVAMGSLAGKTIIMSGGSRGIGLAIALRAARDGANVAIMAKTAEPHPKLPGTIYTAAEEIEAAGGHALPILGDVRDDEVVASAVAQTVERFGGIDIVVNNASALNLAPSESISMKAYDLMQDINARGAFSLSTSALGALKEAENPHILTLSPPITLEPKWFDQTTTAYTISKFSMSLVAIGLAAELRKYGIASNSLWPRTTIDTAAIRNILGAELVARCRSAEIMADAAYEILIKPSREVTGNSFIDDEVLTEAGVTDFSKYRQCAEEDLELDFWMERAAR